jgi:hypothetical protein
MEGRIIKNEKLQKQNEDPRKPFKLTWYLIYNFGIKDPGDENHIGRIHILYFLLSPGVKSA